MHGYFHAEPQEPIALNGISTAETTIDGARIRITAVLYSNPTATIHIRIAPDAAAIPTAIADFKAESLIGDGFSDVFEFSPMATGKLQFLLLDANGTAVLGGPKDFIYSTVERI
jgi:hypothetical protein